MVSVRRDYEGLFSCLEAMCANGKREHSFSPMVVLICHKQLLSTVVAVFFVPEALLCRNL